MKKFTLLTGLAALATVGAVFAVYVENKLTVGAYDTTNDITAGFNVNLDIDGLTVGGTFDIQFAPAESADYHYVLDTKNPNTVVYESGGIFGNYVVNFEPLNDKFDPEHPSRNFIIEVQYTLTFGAINTENPCLKDIKVGDVDFIYPDMDSRFVISTNYGVNFENISASKGQGLGLQVDCAPMISYNYGGKTGLALIQNSYTYKDETDLENFVAAMENTQVVMSTKSITITDDSDPTINASWQLK